MPKFLASAVSFAIAVFLPLSFTHAEGTVQKQERSAIALPSATVLPQEGDFTGQDGVTVVSKSGRFVIAFQFSEPSKFDKVTLVRARGIQDGTAVFLFKSKDAASQPGQMPVVLKSGSFELPNELDSQNFEYFGLAVASAHAAFSDVAPSSVTFWDRLSGAFSPETQMPSTINLLYGHKWGTTPIVAILGFLVIAVGFAFVIVGKPKYALAALLAIWVSYDLLLIRDQFFVMSKTQETFLSPADPQDRTYFDFGNFFTFTDEVGKCLDGKDGDVNFYAPSEWPFNYNFVYQTTPRRSTWNTVDKPYYAAFAGAEIRDGHKFYYRGNLVDENVQVLCSVKGGSLILKKTK